MPVELKWYGDQVRKKTEAAAIDGINRTMADCVLEAKRSHPGWSNISGAAEGSIRIAEFAKKAGGIIYGLWGSLNVNYFIWLELKHGAALRAAADRKYRNLAGYIREAFAR